MIKKKYIVAGNYEEYLAFAVKRNDINTEFIYVNSPRDLIGLSNIEGYYIGTYYNRPDIDNIKERIAIVKAIADNGKEINQLAERLNADKEIKYTDEYSVENYFDIGNGRYVAKEQYKPAEDSVYGNVMGYKFKWNSDIEENREKRND